MAKFSEAELAVGISGIAKNIMTYKTMADKARASRRRDESKQLFQKAQTDLSKLRLLQSIDKDRRIQDRHNEDMDLRTKIFEASQNQGQAKFKDRSKVIAPFMDRDDVPEKQKQALLLWSMTGSLDQINKAFDPQGEKTPEPTIQDRRNLEFTASALSKDVQGRPAKTTAAERKLLGGDHRSYMDGGKPLSQLAKNYLDKDLTETDALELAQKIRALQGRVSVLAKPENVRWLGGSSNVVLDQILQAFEPFTHSENLNPGRQGGWLRTSFMSEYPIDPAVASKVGKVFGRSWAGRKEYEQGMGQEIHNLILQVKAAMGQGQALQQQGQAQQPQGQPEEQKIAKGYATDIWKSASESLEQEDQGSGTARMMKTGILRDGDKPEIFNQYSDVQTRRDSWQGHDGPATQPPTILLEHQGKDVSGVESHGLYHFKPDGGRGAVKDVVDRVASWYNTGGGQEPNIQREIGTINMLATSLEKGEDTPENQKEVFETMMDHVHNLGWPEPDDPKLRLSDDLKGRLIVLLKKFTRKEIKAPTEKRDTSQSRFEEDKARWFDNINNGGNSGYRQNY